MQNMKKKRFRYRSLILIKVSEIENELSQNNTNRKYKLEMCLQKSINPKKHHSFCSKNVYIILVCIHTSTLVMK